MAAPVTLPRIKTDLPLVTDKKTPDRAFTRFWNAAMSQIEDNLNRVIAAQDAADAAQSDADAAMAAAIAAQAQADAALAAAVAAQATADAAKAIADALDAALDVAAGKVLTVLKTLTLDAGADGATLNIGTGGTLGSAAFTNASDYLPSGSSAAFLAKGNNLSDVASVATSRANLGVSATGADVTYAFRANNLSDLTSIPAARANLGITATGADATYAFRANNLSDLGSIPAARGNLGLGTAAVQNTGTSGATVPLLNGTNTFSGVSNTFGQIVVLNPGDAATAILLKGATKGLRLGSNATGATIDGVDSTGVTSYQPLQLGGSVLIITCSLLVQSVLNAANDAAAAGLGVPVNGVYRNGSILMVRVA